MRLSVIVSAAVWVTAAIIAQASPFQQGDVFLSAFDGNVYRYSATGTLLQNIHAGATAFGLSFDASGNLYVATGSSIQKFDSSGNALGAFASSFPGVLHSAMDIGFDPAGNAFVGGIQDTNFDFISKYSATGTLLATASVLQGQENWVYVGATPGNLLYFTAGTTAEVRTLNTATMTEGPGYPVMFGGSNGDVAYVPPGGFLVVTDLPINQYAPSGLFLMSYNTLTPTHGTWIGVAIGVPSNTFWATTDFGEVSNFRIGVPAPAMSFATAVDARAIAVYTAPEPRTWLLIGAGLVLVAIRKLRLRT